MVLMTQIARAFGALLVFTALLGFGYTGVVTLVGTLVWPDQADGSLEERDGEIVGSRLLAQPFTDPGYLWPRPSASGYNADPELDRAARALSYPSNLGPTNPDLIATIEELVEVYGAGVPVDQVTGSGSALDPHLSLAAAQWQAPRIAEARRIDEAAGPQVIDYDVGSAPGLLYVNVLEVNLALDRLTTAG
jgi:K+-transporting ATPase ATPase C chain